MVSGIVFVLLFIVMIVLTVREIRKEDGNSTYAKVYFVLGIVFFAILVYLFIMFQFAAGWAGYE